MGSPAYNEEDVDSFIRFKTKEPTEFPIGFGYKIIGPGGHVATYDDIKKYMLTKRSHTYWPAAMHCPLEEVPLHINSDGYIIAKWRLMRGK
jgi:hypothetical protein